MLNFIQTILDSSTLSPHGYCLTWQPELIWLHVVSDTIIAIAYFSIPFALSIFVSKRPDVEFGWVFWAFAIFIMACGTTHLFSIWTLWIPDYGIEGLVKAVTAIASIVTAVMLWPLLPKLLALPNPTQLREAYAALKLETEERRKAEEMLRQSQKMDAIGQLTGGVAHDFNNLLTIIMGNLELAQQKLGTWVQGAEQQVRRVVDNAMTGARRAATLTERLLAFSRCQPLDPKPTDVNKLILGVSDFFRRTLGENVNLEIVNSAGLWHVEIDQSALESAILNVVVNARDAMANGGGRLTIETSNAYLDENYCRGHTDLRPGQYVLIAITDTGCGMKPEILQRAFEPFFTTKIAGQGTGLGLSQVYGFVKQSGGHVTIDSEVGEGTTVKIYLPRSSHGEPTAEDATEEAVGGHSGETILVVEDDPDVRSYVVEILKELQYEVLATHDGNSALQLLDSTNPRINLLLTDVILPGLNGRELAEQIKKRQPTAKVLFMTGYSRNAIVHQGRLDAGVDLIQKPLTQVALATKIRDLLDART
ncbi:MAG TPA: ATP-binding protein [Xanthobacteraceae bacterium]|nr:ATP-binding protein [Xanthobacteraceae bacterium]